MILTNIRLTITLAAAASSLCQLLIYYSADRAALKNLKLYVQIDPIIFKIRENIQQHEIYENVENTRTHFPGKTQKLVILRKKKRKVEPINVNIMKKLSSLHLI